MDDGSKVLSKINRGKAKVLLLMDNAGCHTADMTDKYGNIKICFPPQHNFQANNPLILE